MKTRVVEMQGCKKDFGFEEGGGGDLVDCVAIGNDKSAGGPPAWWSTD